MRQATIVQATRPVVGLLALVWIVELVNWLTNRGLVRFGISPRDLDGLPGIAFAPFIHGSLGHLASNSVPLLVLGFLVVVSGATVQAGSAASYLKITRSTRHLGRPLGRLAAVSLVVIVVGGIGVWIFGKRGYHVGASGLIFGYFGFLLADALMRRTVAALLLAALTLGLYSALIWGVLPAAPGISWEGHLFGAIGGITAARLMRPRTAR